LLLADIWGFYENSGLERLFFLFFSFLFPGKLNKRSSAAVISTSQHSFVGHPVIDAILQSQKTFLSTKKLQKKVIVFP
jgi:hypothetical protein